MTWRTLGQKRISGRIFFAAIALELAVVALSGWIAGGAPGLRRNDGPPSLTIQFAPAAPGLSARVHNI